MVEMVVLRREDIPLTYSPSFHFFYFSLFLSFSHSFFLAFFFFSFVLLLSHTSKFQKSLHEIRIWRSCFVEVLREFVKCNV